MVSELVTLSTDPQAGEPAGTENELFLRHAFDYTQVCLLYSWDRIIANGAAWSLEAKNNDHHPQDEGWVRLMVSGRE